MAKKAFRESDVNILVADDDPVSLNIIAEGLRVRGFSVFTASDGKTAIHICQTEEIHLTILDYEMEPDGITIAKLLRQIYQHPNFLFISSHRGEEIVAKAAAIGALTYLVKPVDIDQLQHSIRTAYERARELKGLRHNIANQRAFNVASALLAVQYQLLIPEAEEMLYQQARENQQKLWVHAESIIHDYEKRISGLRQNNPVQQAKTSARARNNTKKGKGTH